MENKKLFLREEDSKLLERIYKTMTSEDRILSMDKYGFEDQKPLKGKTEAYHFQFYKSELFNKSQKEKLSGLLKSRGIASGIRFIEQLPTAITTKPETAKIVFECFAEAKGISQPECLFEFLELCDGKNFPLVAFEKDRQGLKTTIEDLRKYIANSENKTDPEKNSAVDDSEKHTDAIKNPSSNIEPVTGETKWLDPYNQYELPLVGREEEFKLLDKFVKTDGQFKIWAISGPSGSGKTRLAIQWALKSSLLGDDWKRLILHKEHRLEPEKWAKWSSDNPTLIIIDYMYGFDEVILQLMNHRSEPKAPKIRLLLIDHVFSEPLHSDKRWGLSGRGSSRNQNEKYFFDLKPLDLRRTENQEEIVESIIAHRAGIDRKSSEVFKAREYLQNTQGAYHPLFAALVGDAIKSGKDFTVWNRRELIDYYLSGEDRLPWEHLAKTGRWASHFVAVATARREVIYDDLFMVGSKFESAPEDFVEVQKICQKIIADDSESTLSPFEPDILGESFFLKFLQFLKTSPKYQEEFRQVFMAGNEESQTKDAIEFIAFIQRLTRNLINDDQNHKETQALWDTLFDFMDPSAFGKAEPIKWAMTAGLIDILLTIKAHLPEKEIIPLQKRIEPAVFYHINDQGRLRHSVLYFMAYFELTHVLGEVAPDLSKEIFALFDRYTANNADRETPLMSAIHHRYNRMTYALIVNGTYNEATLTIGSNALMLASLMGHTEAVGYLVAAGTNLNTADHTGQTALILASITGHVEAVKLMLHKGAEIDATDKEGRTALMYASTNAHDATVKLLLDKGAEIDAIDKEGLTALMYTSFNGYIDTVKLLLDKGANVNVVDKEGCTAFILACIEGHTDTAAMLLEKGAEINAVDNKGRTVLIRAVTNGHTDTVKLLLDKGVEVNVADNEGWTALIWASVKGHVEIVKLLLDKGAEIDAADNKGITALMWGSIKDQVETVRLLLDKGAELNVTDKEGATALVWASTIGHFKTVELLLDRGANIHGTDDGGGTALILACTNGHVETVKLLLDKGANIHVTDKEGGTAFIWASTNGHVETIRVLLDRGADIDATDKVGFTALMWASINGHTATVELLLTEGANIHATDNQNRTPLMLSSFDGHIATVGLLLDRGANINAADKEGFTALFWTCLNNHIGVVELLLNREARVDVVDNKGQTALSIAKAKGHEEIAQLLVNHGA